MSTILKKASSRKKEREVKKINPLKKEPLSQQSFVETKLATKLAEFNIRVYSAAFGKETFVLWTDNLDLAHPILVRVHSECITGDMLGSLHCDCGKQLEKSLQLIAKEGGVLIYLRQEGRGIGLFEKIKSYKLQAKGHDTFDANVLLGHQPDQRSYEMVKTVLDDLAIKRVRLLTNNPSKVSNIAKLGIKIVEYVPLVSKATQQNKTYLETKKKKFQHSLEKPANHYFYQFHVDMPEQLAPIIDYIQHKKNDPLLKICVGITVDNTSLTNKDEIERINSIIKACKNQSEFVPIIHFSFLKSSDILKDANEIKRIWPLASRLQLNDVSILEVATLKKICNLFQVDIPLSDKNFDIVHDSRFRKLVTKNKSFIMLDNSKGTWPKTATKNNVI